MITSLFHWLTQSSIFTKLNLNFGILSSNVWGIWSFDKLKALFHWFMKDKANIIFLQETYGTPEVENVWKYQWRGELFFGHGSEHSRGVLTLVKEGLDCKLKVWKQDELGHYIILKGLVHGQPFIFANIYMYAPNKVNEQCISFYDEFQNE